MVAELSALQQIVTALTGLDGLPAVIVECVITTIYTCKFVYFFIRNPALTHASGGRIQGVLCDR
jgi:hypothetical protein